MLQLERVTVELGAFRLHECSLEIRRGEYRVLLGPTGTGKTVLLETIAGLHRPARGRILLDDVDITTLAPERRHIGVVYQDYALFPHLSVADNIGFGLRLRGGRRELIQKKIHEMAEFFHIGHLLCRYPARLSGGERQRVALARALVLEPDLLLLDEPLSALDRLTRDRLRMELKRIHTELGVTVFHITHDLDEAHFLAERLTILSQGRIVQEGTPEEVTARPASRFVAELMGVKNFLPARLLGNGSAEISGMTVLTGERLAATFRTPHENQQILLIVADGDIDLFAEPDPAYWWQGTMRVAGLYRAGGHGEAELVLPGEAIRLVVSFSAREARRFSRSLERGMEVSVGIRGRGLHWVPQE